MGLLRPSGHPRVVGSTPTWGDFFCAVFCAPNVCRRALRSKRVFFGRAFLCRLRLFRGRLRVSLFRPTLSVCRAGQPFFLPPSISPWAAFCCARGRVLFRGIRAGPGSLPLCACADQPSPLARALWWRPVTSRFRHTCALTLCWSTCASLAIHDHRLSRRLLFLPSIFGLAVGGGGGG